MYDHPIVNPTIRENLDKTRISTGFAGRSLTPFDSILNNGPSMMMAREAATCCPSSCMSC